MFFLYFFVSLVTTFLLTAGVRFLMQRWGVVDSPKSEKRKIHKKKIPLGGGIAIYIAFFAITSIAIAFGTVGESISPQMLLLVALAGLVLMIGGVLDDKYVLRPMHQIIFPVLSAGIVAFAGIGPSDITNPFGGTISLSAVLGFVTLGHVLVFLWLIGMMFTTKFLDGLDGLVSGIVTIGAFMIFFLSRQEQWFQPEVATLAIIFAGACLGFLLWNWHPAKIFLGEGGSLFTGFLLGVLAIISGGKIMTTLLVVGIPLLDVVRVIFVRWRRKQPIHVGDSEHLHYKLLQSGMSHKQVVLFLYALSFSFGITTLFLQSKQKLIAFAFLFILMLLLAIWFQGAEKKRLWQKNS